MFAICIESSHKKGMGHLFRMLSFASFLYKKNEDFIFLINDNEHMQNILKSYNYKYETVNLLDFDQNWESLLIKKYKIRYWVNDRLDTNKIHANFIKSNNIKLITFDDLGSGSKLSDLNFCGLFFNKTNLQGKKIFKGTKYLILNPEIEKFKRERKEIKNILVTLGGSDTYGVTIKVLKYLKKFNIKATIHIGPSFKHKEELQKELTPEYKLINHVSSLIELFHFYDLAITGGGITPFEANASGLPCLIIANEIFEIDNAKYLNNLKSSISIGHHEKIETKIFENIKKIDINSLSKHGLRYLTTDGLENIYTKIQENE
jgi:spore coat polysaccharide biosynthesis predicted glycosyltransferase SpsG